MLLISSPHIILNNINKNVFTAIEISLNCFIQHFYFVKYSILLVGAYLFYAQVCLRVATLYAALHALKDSCEAFLIQQATAIAM